MEQWMVCAAPAQAPALAAALGAARPGAKVEVVADERMLRADLASGKRTGSVLVADPCGELDAVNLAAALVADGAARNVVLAIPGAGGSVRSRAHRAGVKHVVGTADEMRAALASCMAAEERPAARVGDLPSFEDPEPLVHEEPRRVPVATSAAVGERQVPMLCFVSGRGGVGKTALVATVATIAAGWGMRVACLDLDLAFGNLYAAFGMDGPVSLSALGLRGDRSAPSAEELAALGREALPGVELWGPCELPEHAELVQPYASDLIRGLAATHDLLLVDSSPAWSDACALAAQVADRLVLVSDGEDESPASLARAAALAVRLGVARTRICRVANRSERDRDEEDYLLRAHVGLETARSFRLAYSDDALDLLAAGRVDALVEGADDFVRGAESFLAKVLEELGGLPDVPAAREALSWHPRKQRLWPFGREAR